MRFLLLFLSLMLAAAPAQALTVSPLIMEMEASGRNASTSIRVTNNRDSRVAIEIIVERQISEDYSVPDHEGHLQIFPPQVILGPNQSQMFRVGWIGDPSMMEERIYRATVKELPLDLEPPKPSEGELSAQLHIAIAFRTLIIISPANGVSRLGIVGARTKTSDKGVPVVEVDFRNDGNKRARLGEIGLILRHADGRRAALGSGQWALPKGWSRRLVLAGRSRSLEIPLPDASWMGPVSVSLQPR